ncbi:hypothetical protein [Mycoplasmopsis glycophila]|uniref:Uncharacterized protein n=1 Tax=Mycoplasmopsis glycophila TaxID=171285 RepID=A0A449AVQ7_9BACT|nr:hypothetical protein [Mycoplasmopsis glycophila]VEU70660.1 Uncharacterised protein [Mycoplasmopsis glycophila]
MNFNKQQALNLLGKWYEEDKPETLKSRTFYNSYIPDLDSVAFQEAMYEYFENLETLIKDRGTSSINEIFEKIDNELTTIANNNANLYDCSWNWYNDLVRKIDYMLENYKYVITKDNNITNSRDILGIADNYILTDFLREFSNECKSEFEKELELENDKEMTL